MNRCIICGAPIREGTSMYCIDCLYEMKRVRLKDDEPLEEFIERNRENNVELKTHENVAKLERWFEI
ncbi:MAG: hypothetical protein ACP5JE_02890 [Thermoplasmata archaeon]